jgi:hypothetical protein
MMHNLPEILKAAAEAKEALKTTQKVVTTVTAAERTNQAFSKHHQNKTDAEKQNSSPIVKPLLKASSKYENFKKNHPNFAKTIDVLTSRTMGRALTVAGGVLAVGLAAAGTGGIILPAVALAGTVTAISIGIGFQVKTKRNIDRLNETKNLLEESKKLQDSINDLKLDPKIKKLISNGHPANDDINKRSKKEKVTTHEASYTRSAGKSLLANFSENAASIIANALAFNPVGLGFAIGGALLGNTTAAVLRKIQDDKKTALKKQIDTLNETVPGYDNIDELKEIVRKQKIEAKATLQLKEHLSQNPNLTEKQIKDYFKDIALKEAEKEYPKPKELGVTTKAVKAVGNLFKDVATVLDPLVQYRNSSNKSINNIDKERQPIIKESPIQHEKVNIEKKSLLLKAVNKIKQNMHKAKNKKLEKMIDEQPNKSKPPSKSISI